jgi:hypothetical protein
MHNLVTRYSGVVLNQNQKPQDPVADKVAVNTNQWRYQEFFLPDNYVRGTAADERVIPSLTGVQLFVGIDTLDINLEWTIEYDVFGVGWIPFTSGTATESHAVGNKVWLDLMFEEPVEVTEDMLDKKFRLGFRTSDVHYVWFSCPNPLALTFAKARQTDGVTAIQKAGQDVSFMFRLLAFVADEGTDFLGNSYRNAVITAPPDNVNTVDSAVEDKVWLSQPNPSKFAVESLYFDLRSYKTRTYTGTDPDPLEIEDAEVVIDSVLLDPITPNVWFNIYYSSEGEAAEKVEDWEWKMWTRVPKSFQATKRETHILPAPIRAKFIKVEFTHLQAKHYSPGDFARPVSYKKHPKWVLDYFLVRLDEQNSVENKLFTGRVAVVFDALDLAFNYYLDDVQQSASQPYEKDSAYQNVNAFLTSRTDFSDQVDSQMLAKISTLLQPYQSHISAFANKDTLLGYQATVLAANQLTADYPIERVTTNSSDLDIAEVRNESVAFENDFPIMFFYLTCRHRYREVQANFANDRAYFVGVRQIAFQRENYMSAYDSDQYIEPAGDLVNTERNDFSLEDGVMVI